jgi:hypothetical protein
MTPQQIEAMKLALEALGVVTKEMLAIRDELAEYGAGRPITNGIHQLLWDSSFKAYTETAIPAYAALEKALAEHAMRETQRLGQEIEQEPCVHAKTPKECYRVRCQLGDKCVDDEMSFRTTPPQPEQEPVAWPCLIDSADFSENTITLVMQCEDYKVSAGTHWLSTTSPKENT